MVPAARGALATSGLLEGLPDTVVVADREGRIAYVNPAVRVLLGHDPDVLIGQPLQVLMPARFRHGHGEGFSRFRATGQGKLVGATTRVPALHAAGHEVPIDLTLARLAPAPGAEPDGALVVAVLRDASTTILLERQFEVSRYLGATLRVTAALTEARNAEIAFQQLLPTLCAELDWDAATLWQPEGPGGPLVHTGTWTPPGTTVPALEAAVRRWAFHRGEGMPGLAWQRGRPVVIEDLWHDPRFLRTDAVRADELRTGVAFPVLRGDELLAVCELFSHETRPVPPELVDVLASAGRQIGQFLARLRAESEVRELADTLQRSLLPSHLPAIPGIELAARYRAGGKGVFVGGDTYDVAPLPDGRWMVLIADVCGTGAEAAGMTAMTRHTARAASSSGSPAEVLAAVNAALLHEQGPGPLRFVTACCLVLEHGPDGTKAQLALAGHPRPMHRDADGTVSEIGAVGQPLGIAAEVVHEEVGVQLGRGSMLVLYTDGVTEARDDAGVQFGEAGLMAVLRETAGQPADVTVEAVVTAVGRQLAGSRHRPDDHAVLALGC
ncbi:MAG: SpoIIE family protein phosphatase [Actinomycetes bacterium]